MQKDTIIISDYCNKCHIDPDFILMLGEDGLIEIIEIGSEKYLRTGQLLELERYTRLYYDLSINIAGIDAIQHLLVKIQHMKNEIHQLKSELNFYRLKEYEDIF